LEKIGPKNINYKKRWKPFIERIGKELGENTQGTTFGLVPSYSAYLLLDSHGNDKKFHRKELHFSVSHLGKFFQVYGIEKSILNSVIIYGDEEIPCQTENLKKIVVSPYEEYKDYFEKIEEYITDEFKEYRLVPLKIGQAIIDGLQILHLDKEKCSINMALFNDFLGLGEQVEEMEIHGDVSYGMKV